jgi:hypothetical protein
MSRTTLYAEVFVQIVIFYSLSMYFVELEFCGTEHIRPANLKE